jgi:hypothetical protein
MEILLTFDRPAFYPLSIEVVSPNRQCRLYLATREAEADMKYLISRRRIPCLFAASLALIVVPSKQSRAAQEVSLV